MQFQDELAGGTVLVRPALQSPDYAAGSAGWAIMIDGSAEFNNVTIRGATQIGGTSLYYSGTPALGNLLLSIAGAAGTDSYGNAYSDGLTVYGASGTIQTSTADTVTYWRSTSGSVLDIGVGGGSAGMNLLPPTVTGVTWQSAGLFAGTGSRLGANTPVTTLSSPYNNASPSSASISLYGSAQTPSGSYTNEVYIATQRLWVTGNADVNGALTASNLQRGSVSVTFATATTFTTAVTFPTPFATAPTVVTNINSGAGSTGSWDSRAYNVSTTGFTLFVFGPSAAWTNIPVQWLAYG